MLSLFMYLVTAHHMSRSLMHHERSQLTACLALRFCVLGVLAPYGLTAAVDAVCRPGRCVLRPLRPSAIPGT